MPQFLSANPKLNCTERRAVASNKPDSRERQAWRVREFCEALGISNSTFWKYVAAGRIHIIRVGRRVLVPAAEATRITAEGL